VKIWRAFGSHRVERGLREVLPQHVVDRTMADGAEDTIEGLIALGLLKVDAPTPAQCPQEIVRD